MKNMSNIAFVSVAFGDKRYLEQQKRLKESILSIYPLANLFFWYDCLPPGARPHSESLYGFKPHAVHEAFKADHIRRVIWLDPAMILVDTIDDLFHGPPMMAVRDDHKLNLFCSDQALSYFSQTRESIKDIHLVGGSLYYFDFTTSVAVNTLSKWLNAEVNDMFGGNGRHTGSEREHRNDEAIMALSMFTSGASPITHSESRYCCEHNPMWIKKHFK